MNAWDKATREDRVHELLIAKHEALGVLLGTIDIVMLAEKHPSVFSLSEKLAALREARQDYDFAAAAYLDARLTAK